jgi:teichuronic acid biosynthesis glycosyltransferase TuaC
MRVLFLSTVYPKPHAPARGVFCRHLCEALAERHEVRVVSPTPWTERLRHREDGSPGASGSRVVEIHPTYYFPPRVLHSRAHRFMWASIRATVRRLGREFRPDCVLSYWAHPDGAVATRAGRLWDVPVGIIVGGSDVLILPRDRARRRAVVTALEGADAVFVVGHALREATIGLGVNPNKVHIHRQGTHRWFRPGDRAAARRGIGLPEAANVLLWVGRMVPVKGLEVLTDACARLRSIGRDFHLILAGDGPLRGAVADECHRRGLSANVSFRGELANDTLPDWYRAADLVVLSSHSEGVPNVLREALACGTPYVATAVGGVGELTDDPAIRLVPAGDPGALAAAIDQALTNRRRPDPDRARFPDWSETGERLLQILLATRSPTGEEQPTPYYQLEGCA